MTINKDSMKKIIIDEQGEGLMKLLGEYVTFYCASFIYAGTLSGVNEDCVLLTNPSIVYDTGKHDKKNWELSEKMPNDWYLMKSKIESFGKFKVE